MRRFTTAFTSLLIIAALSSRSGTCEAADDKEAVETAIVEALGALPGDTAFLFTELHEGEPVPLFAVRSEQRFAVGSSFKLYILGTLIDEVNAGRRRSENIMLLEPRLVGPPSSELAAWPPGSPVTLHTLALKMISISDNTATDHLIYLLGRDRIERQMEVMGHSDPAVNRPLLMTREMTELRDKKRIEIGRAFKQGDEAARRALLARLPQGTPDYDALDFDTAAYDLAEWYASPRDMAQAMTWIKDATGDDLPAHDLRAILTVDPKLVHDARTWPFVGFKGGSEDQLLAGNWLLEHANGRWYSMHLFWNDPREKVEPAKMIAAIDAIFARISESLR